MTANVVFEAYLGRYIPDRTKLEQPVFCPWPGGGGLVTLPFVVYGEEHAKRIKPGYEIAADGRVTRRVLPGLRPAATVFGHDDRGLDLAWTDANRNTVVAIDSGGRTVWQHRLSSFGCARAASDGTIAVGSVVGELRRLDRAGSPQHDLDSIFANRPFSGPHGIEVIGPRIYLADPDMTHSVWAIDTAGAPLLRIGSSDDEANRRGVGLLCYPFDVVVLDDGSIWVAEHGRRRLAGFDAVGQPVRQVFAADLAADAICTSRLFTDWDRRMVLVFARRQREIYLLGFRPRP